MKSSWKYDCHYHWNNKTKKNCNQKTLRFYPPTWENNILKGLVCPKLQQGTNRLCHPLLTFVHPPNSCFLIHRNFVHAVTIRANLNSFLLILQKEERLIELLIQLESLHFPRTIPVILVLQFGRKKEIKEKISKSHYTIIEPTPLMMYLNIMW